VRIAQIARAAGLPGNLRINYYQIITKAMLCIRPRQPGKPEACTAANRFVTKAVAVLAPGLILGNFGNLRIRDPHAT
jgi:hypothetical protein